MKRDAALDAAKTAYKNGDLEGVSAALADFDSWSEGGNSRAALHVAGGALIGGLGGGALGAFGGAAGAGLSSKLADQMKAFSDSVSGATGSSLIGNLAGNIASGLAGAAVGGTAGAAGASNVNLYNAGNDKNDTEAKKEAQELKQALDKERAMLGQAGAKMPSGAQAATVPSTALAAGAAAAGKGGTSGGTANAVSGLNLNKSLASQQQLSDLATGKGVNIAGSGTNVPLRDAPRLVSEYGGQPGDWSKVSSSSYTAADGAQYEIHAYRNTITGQVVEPKSIPLK
ncbi:hypothetical protein [Paraburkholderia sacchari]|nr:hypothetical protein [Paraburkholderia sacchari]